jgi:hypothetical protein
MVAREGGMENASDGGERRWNGGFQKSRETPNRKEEGRRRDKL